MRTFRDVTDELTSCCRLSDVADALGVSYGLVKQARMRDTSSPSYRSPPKAWREGLAKLARQRAKELEQLAEQLEK